jgi:hypothetical protein
MISDLPSIGHLVTPLNPLLTIQTNQPCLGPSESPSPISTSHLRPSSHTHTYYSLTLHHSTLQHEKTELTPEHVA